MTVEADMGLDRMNRVVQVFQMEEQLQHDDTHYSLAPKDMEGDNPDSTPGAGTASCDVEEAGIVFRSRRNWALLPHVGVVCLDWAPLASTALSNEAFLAESTRGSRH